MSPAVDTLHDPLETLCIRALHASASVAVYDVHCCPHDKQRGPEERSLAHQIVFPRRGVFEFESRGEKLIADANHVLFFNRDEGYHVAHPAGAGDDCTVFAFDDRVLREVVQRTRLFLATAFGENASLDDVGRAVHASPFHLARLFRRESGLSIHRYRHRLRLRAALARIADGETNLSALALELGFSSHSHLTDAFRLAFGMSPAECRKSLDVRRFRQMSRDLEVPPSVTT